jgi:hypothetical protein
MMSTCTECGAEVSGDAGRCAGCGSAAAGGPVWRVVFRTWEGLRKHFDRYMVHHGLVVPRSELVERDSLVRLRLVLPDAAGDVWLTGRVITSLEQPSGSKAAYAVQLELLDLSTAKKELLRPVTRVTPQAGASRAEDPEERAAAARPAPDSNRPAPCDASRGSGEGMRGSDDLDAFLDGLIERRDQPPPVDPPASTE